ncbi:MAG TPA: hypothetical protein VJN22_08720 [Candidatus Eremiobacteraceae bacterium]|nr:hypothetical protein [Candidatus Eremiobacteraceae bacterium]
MLIAFAIAVVVSGPIAVSAQSSTSAAYTTALTQIEPVPAPGEFDGRLKLTVTPDGIVSGYYFPMDSGTIVSVVGGEKNGKYWMDIGGRTQLHVYAERVKDGSLVGTATPMPHSVYLGHESVVETFRFVAKPAAR